MDISLVTGAVTAIKVARQIGSAALKVRDFNQFAGTIAEINDQLLKAQESLFAHNADMMDLQQKYFEACEELRKLKATAAERGRYSLRELAQGVFAYQLNASSTAESEGEPSHYLCQPCFDKGIKSVLQDKHNSGPVYLHCTICDANYRTNRSNPYPRISV